MSHTDRSCQASEAIRTAGCRRKRSIIAIATIVAVCYAMALFITPADPYSFLIGWGVLILLAVPSYYVGYVHGARRTPDGADSA